MFSERKLPRLLCFLSSVPNLVQTFRIIAENDPHSRCLTDDVMRINFRFHFWSRGHFRAKFNMAAIRHLGFVGGSRGTTHEGSFVVAISPLKFCHYDRISSVQVISI